MHSKWHGKRLTFSPTPTTLDTPHNTVRSAPNADITAYFLRMWLGPDSGRLFPPRHSTTTQFDTPLRIEGQDNLDIWGKTLSPDHSDVLQRFYKLEWLYITNLWGVDQHLRGLTGVKVAKFCDCRMFYSIEALCPLANLGCGLVELEIDKAETSPTAMEGLLACLPHLRRLLAHRLEITPEPTFVAGPTPPFFQDANEMTLLSMDYSPEKICWIPSSAKFSKLRIGALCISQNPQTVNKWVISSRETLKYLHLDCDFSDRGFSPLILTECRSLEILEFPRVYADMILAYVDPSNLSKVILHCKGPTIDWSHLEDHLLPLAKSKKFGRKKMAIDFVQDDRTYSDMKYSWNMPECPCTLLCKKARVKIRAPDGP